MVEIPTMTDLEPDVHDLRNMAAVTRDFITGLFSPASKECAARTDCFMIMEWQVEAAEFCINHLNRMVAKFSDDYIAALENSQRDA